MYYINIYIKIIYIVLLSYVLTLKFQKVILKSYYNLPDAYSQKNSLNVFFFFLIAIRLTF